MVGSYYTEAFLETFQRIADVESEPRMAFDVGHFFVGESTGLEKHRLFYPYFTDVVYQASFLRASICASGRDIVLPMPTAISATLSECPLV